MTHSKKSESDPSHPDVPKQKYYVGKEEIHFREHLHDLEHGISKEYHHLIDETKEWTAKHSHHSSGDHSDHHKKEETTSPPMSSEVHHREGLGKVTEEGKVGLKQETKAV